VSDAPTILKLFLDEGVPDSVGKCFEEAGHSVIYGNIVSPGAPDQLVSAISEANEAILVALDADMKRIARQHGVGKVRFRRLSLIKLSCRETRAAARVRVSMSLIEHEWRVANRRGERRIFIEIGDSIIRTFR
jgi:predicted nuclease of predicted toxin-antitoxin system